MNNDKDPIIPSKEELNKRLEEISKEKTEFRERAMTANCYCPVSYTRPLPSPEKEKKQKNTLVSKILNWLKK